MIALIVLCSVFAVVAIGAIVYAGFAVHRITFDNRKLVTDNINHANEIVARMHHDTAEVLNGMQKEIVSQARSVNETVAKNLPIFMQTAVAISENVDRRVRERIRVINAAVEGGQTPESAMTESSTTLGEMPAMFTSAAGGDAAEAREIERERTRFRRDGEADTARDAGIGHDDIPQMPLIRSETL